MMMVASATVCIRMQGIIQMHQLSQSVQTKVLAQMRGVYAKAGVDIAAGIHGNRKIPAAAMTR